MLYQIVRLSFTNNPPQSRRFFLLSFLPPLAEHRREVLSQNHKKMTFSRKCSYLRRTFFEWDSPFRYYSPDEGMYISQDPIGLAGNNPTLYGYVHNPKGLVDVFGLIEYNATEVLGRKVYQNSTDFITVTPLIT